MLFTPYLGIILVQHFERDTPKIPKNRYIMENMGENVGKSGYFDGEGHCFCKHGTTKGESWRPVFPKNYFPKLYLSPSSSKWLALMKLNFIFVLLLRYFLWFDGLNRLIYKVISWEFVVFLFLVTFPPCRLIFMAFRMWHGQEIINYYFFSPPNIIVIIVYF